MRRNAIVEQVSQTIHRVEPSATAILYGSEARGDARPDSDIDVLVLNAFDRCMKVTKRSRDYFKEAMRREEVQAAIRLWARMDE